MMNSKASLLSLIIIAVFSLMAFLFWYKINYLFMSIIIIIVGLFFLKYQPEGNMGRNYSNIIYSKYNLKISYILFFLLITFTTINIITISEYSRPTWIMAVFIFSSGILCYQALGNKNKIGKILYIIETIILGFLCIYSQSHLFPTTIGTDSWIHQTLVDYIVINGHIIENELYSGTPLYHILIVYANEILNVPFKMSIDIVIMPLFLIITGLSLMALSKKHFTTQIAYISLLLFVISSNTIIFGLIAIPNTLGVAIITLIIMITFNLPKTLEKTVCYLILMISLIVYHSVSSIILLSIFISIYIINKIDLAENNVDKNNVASILSSTTVLIFATILFSWWLYMTTFIDVLSIQLLTGFSSEDFFQISPFIHQYSTSINPLTIIYDESARTGFLALAIIGILTIINSIKDKNGATRACIGLCASIPILIAFATTIAGMQIIQTRWWFAGITLLIPVIGYGILTIDSTMLRKNMWHGSIAIMFVLLLAFTSIFTPMACIDNPILSKETTITDAYRTSEMVSANYVAEYYNNHNISTDEYFMSSALLIHLNMSLNVTHKFSIDFLSGSYIDVKQIYLLRTIVINGTFAAEREPFRFSFNVQSWLYQSGMERTYFSKGASIFQP